MTSAADPTHPHSQLRPLGGLRLIVLWPGGHAERSLEPGRTIIVGRATDCDVHILDPSVSRHHLAIHAGPPVTAEDLGSGNGSRLGGRALAPRSPLPLTVGDALEFGSAVAVLGGEAAMGTVGRPDPMASVERLLALTAPSSISVLLIGETGVGKSRAASRIHAASARAKGPFVQVNCAAIAPNLIESELFGHERGAFTGAVSTKSGLLQAATGGTLFLDEVGELPLEVQAKLLQALETRQVRHVGGLTPIHVDIRVVSATNRNIAAEVAAGRFRADLYFRLNGVTISLPSLRGRPEEIARLARHFLAEGRGRGLSRAAMHALTIHAWPGNIRELHNVIARAIVLSGGGVVDAEHLLLEEEVGRPSEPARATSLQENIAEVERAHIERALRDAGGNQSRAAELLGMSRRTLIERLDAYGMPRPRKSRRP